MLGKAVPLYHQPCHISGSPRTPNVSKVPSESALYANSVFTFLLIAALSHRRLSISSKSIELDVMSYTMSDSVSANDDLREMRARQAALRDEFVTTNAVYQTLSERIHQIELSAVDCAKLYGEETTALAADPSAESKLGEFVEVLSGSIVELASRIHYSEDDIRTKLVDFVAELQKVVVKDPESLTGEQLRCCSNQKLWTDLPMYWIWCSEERVSFGKWTLSYVFTTPRADYEQNHTTLL